MNDIVTGLGLVLVIEGLLWALFPGLATRLLEAAAAASEQGLRTSGAVAMAAGVLLVWLAKG
jgi:hypothetical protein